MLKIKWMIAGTLALSAVGFAQKASEMSQAKPNILWLMAEDMSPQMGCYGDPDALTPRLNRFAEGAVRYENAYSAAPVCAPARTTLVAGMPACTLGAGWMRSAVQPPKALKLLPQILQENGYFCAVNKTDYNLDTGYDSNKTGGFPNGWSTSIPGSLFSAGKDMSERIAATWRKRKPGQPFFLMATLGRTHESRYGKRQNPDDYHLLRNKFCYQLTPEEFQDRRTIHLPAYMNDTPVSREYWAQYQEAITDMDHVAGQVLDLLESDGLAENTLVFFFGDNGAGTLGTKGYLTDQGLHVPLIIRIPEKWRSPSMPSPGGVEKRMVSFEDFAPTVLSLIGQPIPPMMQGRPFLGPETGAPRKLIFGFRDRIDEQTAIMRSVSDGRYAYVWNLLPSDDLSPKLFSTMVAPWICVETQELSKEGRLTDGIYKTMYSPARPAEELYDLQSDPFEVHNLANDPKYRSELDRLHAALVDHMLQSRDLDLLPELEIWRLCAEGEAPYSLAQSGKVSEARLKRLIQAAELIRRPPPDAEKEFLNRLDDSDAAVRWWAVQGLICLHRENSAAVLPTLTRRAAEDDALAVRLAAAKALCRTDQSKAGFDTLLSMVEQRPNPLAMLLALRELTQTGEQGKVAVPPAKEIIENPPKFSGAYARKVLPILTFQSSWICEKFGAEAEYKRNSKGWLPWYRNAFHQVLDLEKVWDEKGTLTD